jgi:hypothetical protein
MSDYIKTHKTSLLSGASVGAIVVGASLVVGAIDASAADKSANFESGIAIIGSTSVDTFTIDNTNDGEGLATQITFGAGTTGLTVASAGLDAQGVADLGEIGNVITADNSGTNVLTLNDASNGDDLTLVVNGTITGNVAIAGRDLDTVVNAVATNDGGDSILSLKGNVVVDTGTITLTSDTNDVSILEFSGTAAQTSDAAVATSADNRSIVRVTNTGGAVTINDIVGVAGTGLASMDIDEGAQLIVKAGATNAITFDVVGNVDDGAGAAGGTLTLASGDGVDGANTIGGALTLATITGNTTLTTLNIAAGDGADGANAAIGGAGGAITNVAQVGTTTVTNLNISGGTGGAGFANSTGGTGGAGGAVSAATFTGAITGATAISGGTGGVGGAGGAGANGSVGGAGGAVTITNLAAGITGNLTASSGTGGVGGLDQVLLPKPAV